MKLGIPCECEHPDGHESAHECLKEAEVIVNGLALCDKCAHHNNVSTNKS